MNKIERKRFIRLIAGIIGLTGLGVIVTEVINSLQWFGFRLPPVVVAILILFFYVGYEFFTLQFDQRKFPAMTPRLHRLNQWYHFVIGLIGFLFLLSIPFLWWEVIKRLSQTGYR